MDSKDGAPSNEKSSTPGENTTDNTNTVNESRISVAAASDAPDNSENVKVDHKDIEKNSQQHQDGGEQIQGSSAPADTSNTYEGTDAPYCVLPESEKIFIMLLVSFAAIISPISSSIYFPALNNLASDLNFSISMINISITTYLVSQIQESQRKFLRNE